MLAEPAVRSAAPDEVWITWCDQVAIHPVTIQRLVELDVRTSRGRGRHANGARARSLTSTFSATARAASSRFSIVAKAMPCRTQGRATWDSSRLPSASFTDLLPRYTQEVALGTTTGERNFLPFIAWASAEHEVVTFPVG